MAGLYWFYGFSRSRAGNGHRDEPHRKCRPGLRRAVRRELSTAWNQPALLHLTAWPVSGTAGDGLTPESGTVSTPGRLASGMTPAMQWSFHVRRGDRGAGTPCVWTDAGTTHVVKDRIYAGDRLFVLGEFTTSEPRFDLKTTVADNLFRWRAESPCVAETNSKATANQGRLAEDRKQRRGVGRCGCSAVRLDAEGRNKAALAEHHAVNLIKVALRTRAQLRDLFALAARQICRFLLGLGARGEILRRS